jgi:hypothetical protein
MTRRYAILANADLAIYDLAECIIANALIEPTPLYPVTEGDRIRTVTSSPHTGRDTDIWGFPNRWIVCAQEHRRVNVS